MSTMRIASMRGRGGSASGSPKGSLAVNTAEKQRAQSISHLRRQAIDRAAKPHCQKLLLLSVGLRSLLSELYNVVYTTITSKGPKMAMAPRRAGAPTHIPGNSLEFGFALPKS